MEETSDKTETNFTCKDYPKRAIAKAKVKPHSNIIYNGSLYVENLSTERKMVKLQQNLKWLNISSTNTVQPPLSLTLTQQSPETPKESLFSIGTSTSTSQLNKRRSKHRTGLIARGDDTTNMITQSLHSIQLTPATEVLEVPTETRLKMKDRMRILHDDLLPELSPKLQSTKDGNNEGNDEGNETPSLGFRNHKIVTKYPIIKGRKPQRVVKKLLIPIIESIDDVIQLPDNIDDQVTANDCYQNNDSHSNDCHGNNSHNNSSHSNDTDTNNVDSSQTNSLPATDPNGPINSNHDSDPDNGDDNVVATTRPIGILPSYLDLSNYSRHNTIRSDSPDCEAKIGRIDKLCPTDITSPALFGETSTIDKIVIEFLSSSVDKCLFFYPKSINGSPNLCGITQYFSLELIGNAPFRYHTLLHMVAYLGHLDTVKYVIETYKAKVDVLDCCHRTPLMIALSNPLIVDYLIKAGANVNHQDNHGISALMMVVMSTNYKIRTLKLLLTAGADTLLTDIYGHSVMYHALVSANKEIITILLRYVPFFPNSRVGQFTFAGRPLFTQLASLSPALVSLKFYVPTLPDSLKLSLFYLTAANQASFNLQYNEYDNNVYMQLKEVLKRKQEMKVIIDYPANLPPIYNGRKEVQTVEELEKFCVKNGEDIVIDHLEMAFQSLMINERIIGHASYNSVNILQFIVSELFVKYEKENLTESVLHDKMLPVFRYFLETLLQCVKGVGPLLEIANIVFLAFDMVKRFNYNKTSQTELSRILFDIIIIYYTSLSKLHIHLHDRSRVESIQSYLRVDIDFLNFLLKDLDNNDLVSAFVKECPSISFSKAPLIKKTISQLSNEDFDKLIKVLDPNIFDTPFLETNDYLLHRVDMKSKSSVDKLLEYGAHPDVVSARNYTILGLGSNSTRTKHLSGYLYPSSLYCTAAKAVLSHKIPYRFIQLPQHVVNFIGLHDKDTFQYVRMVELGFVHHDFAFDDEFKAFHGDD